MCFDRIRIAGLIGLLILTACAPRHDGVDRPTALTTGAPQTVFAVTTRAREPNGSYGWTRSAQPDLLELTVSVPPDRTPGQLAYHTASPDPARDFLIARREIVSGPQAFTARLSHALAELPRGNREISIFIHGFNATQSETAFRVAQVATDIGVPGIKAIYSWPSRGTPLGYVHDHDSMLFARDGLEQMLSMAVAARPERLLVVAHSMGGLLLMETLRQIEIERPGWTARHIGGVVLVAPDVDVEVFRRQVDRFADLPQPFILFVSGRDPALSLSAFLRGTPEDKRLGNLDNTDKLADLPITVIDATPYAADAASPHMVPATSPTLIALLRDVASTSAILDAEGQTGALLGALPILQSGASSARSGEDR